MNNIFKIRIISTLICLFTIVGCKTQEKTDVAKITEIAVLMPLSGAEGKLGNRLSNFIETGLEDNIQTNVNLIKYDANNDASAIEMMEKIAASNAKIVLGPLLSNTTNAVEKIAKNNGITIISLSNNPSLAAENTYVFGHSPITQTTMLLEYVATHEYQNIILFLPQNNYLAETTTNLKKIIFDKSEDTKVETIEYSLDNNNLSKSLTKLSKLVDDINENSFNNSKPVILLSDKPENLMPIIDMLHTAKLDKKAVIIGDHRSNISSRKQNLDFIFTGNMNIYNNNNSKLEELKQKMNVHDITSLDLLAYDLGRVTAYCLGDNFSLQLFKDRLNSLNNFDGHSGILRMQDSIILRQYDIIKRQGSEYSIQK